MFKKVYGVEGGSRLTDIVKVMQGKAMCKLEQLSNWEKRPLRKSQMHYATLDAYLLTVVFKKLVSEFVEKGIDSTQFEQVLELKIKDKGKTSNFIE